MCALLAIMALHGARAQQLSPAYYDESCPHVYDTVRRVIQEARTADPRILASLVRLQFHDCFVNGCDGSVLMDATPTMAGEKEALSNINSLRSFEVVDEVKSALEEQCPGVVSGSHSIGEARCFSIVFRLYNQSGSGRPDPHMDPAYRQALDALCPLTGDQNVTGGLDATPVVFDNQYFKDLVHLRGFLNSDQTLFSDNDGTRRLVAQFSENQDAFFRAFIEGMIKMGELQNPRKGEIRRNCRVANGGRPPLEKQVAPFRVLDF